MYPIHGSAADDGFVNVKTDKGANGQGLNGDDTQAFIDTINEINTYGGVGIIPPGWYHVRRQLPTITHLGASLVAPAGPGATRITYSGFNDFLKVKMNPFSTYPAGKVAGLWVDGSSNAANAVHVVDTIGFGFEDCVFQNFITGNGVLLENVSWFCERIWTQRLWVYNNATGLRWKAPLTGDYASFGYHRMQDLRINTAAEGQIGLALEGQATPYSIDLTVIGNFGANNCIAYDLKDSAYLNGRIYSTIEQTDATGGIPRRMTGTSKLAYNGTMRFENNWAADSIAGTARLQGWGGEPVPWANTLDMGDGALYVEAGVLKYKFADGSVTTFPVI